MKQAYEASCMHSYAFSFFCGIFSCRNHEIGYNIVHMKKTVFLLTAALLLAGCGKGNNEPEPAQPQEAGDITLLVWCDEAELAGFQEKADAFTSQSPDKGWSIIIQTESLDTVSDTVLTDPAVAADIYEYPEHDAGMLMEAGALPHREDGIYGIPVEGKDGVLVGLNPNSAHPKEAEELANVLTGRTE